MGSIISIFALIAADAMVIYAFFTMQSYLTGVWRINLTHAAAIINIWNGIYRILPVFLVCLVDLFLGNFKLLVFTSLAYTTGMSLVAMSTPPILASLTHNCKQYDPRCIGPTQKFLLYAGLALTAVGKSGLFASFRFFYDEQIMASNNHSDCRQVFATVYVMLMIVLVGVVIVALIVSFTLLKLKLWAIWYGIPAICTFFSTFIFLICSCAYKKAPPKGSSPLFTVCRVFVATALKASQPYPDDHNQYEGIDEKEFSETSCLRGLHKAAIKIDDTEIKGWKLCSVAEVEDAKMAVRMAPMWLTFLICGIVESSGNTYFVEQAGNLNGNIGMLKFRSSSSLHIIPILLLRVAKDSTKILINFIQKRLFRRWNRVWAPSIGIALGMTCSILCCISAAGVEKMRLAVVRRHGLFDKPDEEIPLSIYWLLFQFLLLGAFDSFFKKGVNAYYEEQSPESMKSYLRSFPEGVSGLGYISSVVCVYAVGRVSERGGRANWFQETLNTSRLDRYYWVLAALSTVNLFVFVLVAMRYKYQKAGEERQDGAQGDCLAACLQNCF